MKVKVAIQCRDKMTDKVGTFGYEVLSFACTPVFYDMVEFIDWCNKNGVERDYTPERGDLFEAMPRSS